MKAATLFVSLALGAVSLAGAAFADPPGRVGRLSYVEGNVSVQTPEQRDWLPAMRNFPVTRDEAFWTEPGARAELEIGPIEVFMDDSTELQIDELDYGVTQLSLPEGVIHVEVWRLPDGGVRIETPQGEVRLVEPGAYRIDSGSAGGNDVDTVLVTTLRGRAEIAGPNVRVPVERYQTAEIDYNFRIEMYDGGPEDIDNFAQRRLAQYGNYSTPRYVSDDYSGYADLGYYGDWETGSEYGPVWYPRGVAADWAPYRDGRWEYVSPWGWTWIDDAPWGFTPFHYGRWTQIRGRWCWSPGEFSRRPIYAPALVTFIGSSVDIGWVPLAPYEIYNPYYSVSTTYIRNINITNVNRVVINRITVDNIRNERVDRYRNDHYRTFVRQDDFRRGDGVRRASASWRDGGHGSGPISVDRIRPGQRDLGHAPRGDGRRQVMRAPQPNAVPQTPTAPAGRNGAWQGRRDRDGGGAVADRRGGNDRGRIVSGDGRQPPTPPGRTARNDGQGDDRNRGGDNRRTRFGDGQTGGQPPATADNRSRRTTGDGQQARRDDADRGGAGRGDGGRRGRFGDQAGVPPQQTPTTQPPAGNDNRDRVRTARGERPDGGQPNGGQPNAGERRGRFGGQQADAGRPTVEVPRVDTNRGGENRGNDNGSRGRVRVQPQPDGGQPPQQADNRPDRGDRGDRGRGREWQGGGQTQQQPVATPQEQPRSFGRRGGDNGGQGGGGQPQWRREESRQQVSQPQPQPQPQAQPQQERQRGGGDGGGRSGGRGRNQEEAQQQQPQGGGGGEGGDNGRRGRGRRDN
jgi:hypothetical protein